MDRSQKIRKLVGAGIVPEQAKALLEVFEGPAVPPEAEAQVLYYIRGADLQSTADQAFTKVGDWHGGIVAHIYATNGSAAATSAAGGIYTEPAKGGTNIVSNTQSWASLTTPQRILTASMSATQSQVNGSLYLSLTTGSSVPATADIFVVGVAIQNV